MPESLQTFIKLHSLGHLNFFLFFFRHPLHFEPLRIPRGNENNSLLAPGVFKVRYIMADDGYMHCLLLQTSSRLSELGVFLDLLDLSFFSTKFRVYVNPCLIFHESIDISYKSHTDFNMVVDR